MNAPTAKSDMQRHGRKYGNLQLIAAEFLAKE